MSTWGSNYDRRVELATRAADDKEVLPEKVLRVVATALSMTPEELFDLYVKENADKAAEQLRQTRKQDLAAEMAELAEDAVELAVKKKTKFKESDHPRGPGGIFVRADELKGKAAIGIYSAALSRKEAELAALDAEFQTNVVETSQAMKELSEFQMLLGQQPPKYEMISLGDWETATSGMEQGCSRGIQGACAFAPKMRKLTNAIYKGGMVALNRQNKQAEVAQSKSKLASVEQRVAARKARRVATATK